MRTVEGSAAEKKRNGTIDFWRFIFAAGIVMYHARPLFGRDLFVCGYIGVEFFFIVSGCLLMKKADKRRMQAENAGGSLDIYGENLKMIRHKVSGILPYLLPAILCAALFRFIFSGMGMLDMLREIIYGLPELFSLQMFGFKNSGFIDVAWYLSALFIVSFLLYPILLRRKRGFVLYAAPLLVLFIYGFFSRTLNGAVNMPTHWYGFCYKGLLRGMAGMSLGCISYALSDKIKKHSFSQKERAVLTAVEFAGYFTAVFHLVFCPVQESLDFFIIFLLFVSVTISFSGRSHSATLFDRRIFVFLGEFSLPMFLNHSYVRENMKRLFGNLLPQTGGIVSLYLFLVSLLGMLNFWLGKKILRLLKDRKKTEGGEKNC